MRRFELVEGSSSKFWQVEREDDSVRVQFGRIGTNGQTQLKTFGSGDLAQKEMDKLIKEKLKKGYTEVGGSDDAPAAASPAPKPAAPAKAKAKPAAEPEPKAAEPEPKAAEPEPKAAEPEPKAAEPAKKAPALPGSISWTDAALRAAAPIRGSDLLRAAKPDAKAIYARLRKVARGLAEKVDKGVKRRGANKDLTTAVCKWFESETLPSTFDTELQAAAYLLVGQKLFWNDEPRANDFLRLWLAKEGGMFALKTLARAETLFCEVGEDFIAITSSKPADSKQIWWRNNQKLEEWRGLRLITVLATDADLAELTKEAESMRRSCSPELRATLAAGFDRFDWCEKDTAWPALLTAPTYEEAEQFAGGLENMSSDIYGEEIFFDVLARFGTRATQVLMHVVQVAGSDNARRYAEGLAMITSSEVAELFVKNLENNNLRPVAVAYLHTHPEVSLEPLARAAIGKGAAAEAAKTVLKSTAASAKEVVTQAMESFPPAARELLAKLAESSRAREEARPEELPRVLHTPPWTTKAKLAAPAVLELGPLSLPESMQWKPGEEEERRSGYPDEEPRAAKQNVERIRTVSASVAAADERPWTMQNASIFAQLPKKALLEVTPWVNLSRFNFAYYGVLQTLVGRHGVDAIDFVLRASSEDSTGAITALVRCRSVRVASLMANAFARLKKSKAEASEWLAAFPEEAAVGLIPDALGKPGKKREAAEIALRFVASKGHRAVIETVAKKYGPEAEKGVASVLDFDPLLTFPSKLPKLPAFFSPGAYTRPLLAGGDKAVPESALEALGTMLAFTSLDDPYPGIAEVKQACDARSLAEFAWDLFQAWLVAGASSKEQWAFTALGHLGDDECARKLTPLVRAWPGEASHARAVVGLDVLARIGTDVALMHLHGIAQKLKFKGLQEKAREKIDQIAEARGLTAEELADRLVPDLGLDDSGSLALDFGPRTFRVVFDETLKPSVTDETGKRLPDLPKPKQSDDAEKAQEATEIWKALKKDAKTIASGQILRLEIAMCAERRWTADVFRQFLVEHPLLVHVVRRLVWGVYDANSALVSTFRVAEDRSLANERDDAFELPQGASVGIVHRLDLSVESAARWGQIFGDYEIIQPFSQLSRETTTPTDSEKTATSLTRVAGLTVPTGKVLGLDHHGWRRGPPQDAGVVGWYEKAMAGGIVASLDLDPGIFTGMVDEAPEQKLGPVTLSRGGGGHWGGGGASDKGLCFGELSPIAFSELVRDLESLRV